MSNNFLKKIPCPKCREEGGDRKGDNLALYRENDGRVKGYCWGGHADLGYVEEEEVKGYQKQVVEDFDEVVGDLPHGTHRGRKVSDEVAKFFDVQHEVNPDGTRGNIYYPYTRKDGGVSKKVRMVPKDFRVQGGLKDVHLFGQSLFPEGGRKVIIVEGEEDALAVAEAHQQHYGKIYPVVSLPSAGNVKPVAENIKWVQSFNEVILWTDTDEAGQKAQKELAKIIGYHKCKVAAGKLKDASDLLTTSGYKAVMEAVWNASQYNPQGILTSKELWKSLEEDQNIVSVPYPPIFRGLNDKTKGMRFGEISLFTSGTGAGKSSMMREIMMHILENTEDKVGVISLEESPSETVRKLCMMKLMRNPGNEELSLTELQEPFQQVFGEDRVVVLDHQGAITESITSQLNYMAAIGCKYLFVDHITILVSEGAEGLTGNEATDKVMNDLLKVAKTHNVWIGLVSHLRKSDKVGKSFEQGNMPSLDDIRGSGSIKQIAMDIIAFARNSEEGENTVKLKVLKCRKTGKTGPAGSLLFDDNTGRMLVGPEMEELDEF